MKYWLVKIHFVECFETYTDKAYVTIYSPHYPALYTAHHNCVWKIQTKTPQFYMLSMNHFDLNYSPNCTMDYLKITDKSHKLSLQRLCGVHDKILIASRTSELSIHFKSKSTGGTGFYLTYKKVDNHQQRYIQVDDEIVKGSKFNSTTYS